MIKLLPVLSRLRRRHPVPRDESAVSGTLGRVTFVGAGPGAADLLTLRAAQALASADIILHDRLISPEVLALAPKHVTRRDVGKTAFGRATPQDDINRLLVQHAASGAHVVRLKSGDSTIFGRLDEEITACDAARIAWEIVPGITAASAAVAAIGQSLTRRGRNASVQLLTGHDVKGFCDHDWSSLAQEGQVCAIYMGKSSARFIQGRLLMHGADRSTPVTLVENASRRDQRVIATTLASLDTAMESADSRGPVLTFIGLSPRHAADMAPNLPFPVPHKETA